MVIYESPHRLLKTLEIIHEIIPNREIAVAKELSKIYEKLYRGYPIDVIEKIKKTNLKGEYIIIIKGKNE